MSYRMKDEEWLPQVERLLVGGRMQARGDHECGDPGSLMITKRGAEVTAYCFRCGGTGFHKERETPAERFKRMQAEQEANEFVRGCVSPPEPTSRVMTEWPKDLAAYFYTMGIFQQRADELGMYYSAAARRVIVPVLEDGEPVFWLGRSQTMKPKWLGPDVKKRGLFAKYGGTRGKYVVLTEDPLSAYKVGLCCMAWSLLGTKLHNRHALELLKLDRPVVVWLDDDHDHYTGINQGQVAAASIKAALESYGLVVHNMTSPKDPKYYSQYQLQEKLSCLD
ncbi:DNA primase [Xanthomonas phage SB4]|uniref:DNA primase n=1 Tax=Xanthomonas phage SB4 TaxID=3117473 RepID=A0ABZ2GY93_9CAUD